MKKLTEPTISRRVLEFNDVYLPEVLIQFFEFLGKEGYGMVHSFNLRNRSRTFVDENSTYDSMHLMFTSDSLVVPKEYRDLGPNIYHPEIGLYFRPEGMYLASSEAVSYNAGKEPRELVVGDSAPLGAGKRLESPFLDVAKKNIHYSHR